MEVVVTTGAKSCKDPVKSSSPTNPTSSFFYRPDALPFTQPKMSIKALKGKISFHGLAYPKLTWGSSNFVSDH